MTKRTPQADHIMSMARLQLERAVSSSGLSFVDIGNIIGAQGCYVSRTVGGRGGIPLSLNNLIRIADAVGYDVNIDIAKRSA